MRTLLIGATVLSLLAIPQAEARGGGGGGFRSGGIGIHIGSPRIAFRTGNFIHHQGFHQGFGRGFHQGFGRNRSLARFDFHQSLARFDRQRFARDVSTSFPWWGGGYWPTDWGGWSGYAYQPVQQQSQPTDPQIIVIHADDKGRTMTADAMPNYDVAGCHAIPNGYHCDTH